MKKIIPILSIFFIGIMLVLPCGVSATSEPITGVWEDWSDIESFINFIQAVVWFVFVIGVIVCFALAGFYFMTAAGDETKIEKAKTWVKWGLIGVAVGVLAGGLLLLVENLLRAGPADVTFLIRFFL